ncbi:MAG: TetR family transcriptional regulator [Alteromonadaceae bacterium]|nr:TetR family transcriptional regulator [Alteromonadaceae bacterium]
MDELPKKTTVKRRSKGEQTRKKILTSAIAILAGNGIKGTTHRAVAKHANIQLSLTTYYFKDIQDLIHQAFQLNYEQIKSQVNEAWQYAFTIIESFDKKSLRKIATKVELCEQLTKISVKYLHSQICHQPVALAVEQLLFTEIQITPELRKLADEHKKALITPFIQIAKYFNKIDPEIYADIMLTIFTQLEYRHLSEKAENINLEEMKKIIRKMIAWVIGIKV